MDAPLRQLQQERQELARRWFLHFVAHAPLEQIARLPADRLARELPELFSELLRAAGEEVDRGVAAEPGQAVRSAARLTSLRGETPPEPEDLGRDVAALQSAVVEALASELTDSRALAAFACLQGFVQAVGSVLGAAVSEVLERRLDELAGSAGTDPLTGLPGVRHLEERLHHLLDMHQRYGHPFAVVMVDLDGLKRINDARGRPSGDRALASVAAALRGTIRSIDTPVRMDGDEFCVLAPEQTASRAVALGNRITEAVESLELFDGMRLAVSIGVASAPEHGSDGDRLLALADEAMWRSRASGRRVEVASATAPGASTQGGPEEAGE